MKAKDIRLKLTCSACPEQYDAFYNGVKVGYLRLRHGHFTVEYPDCGGELIYSAYPNSDGRFEYDERAYYMKEARKAIRNRIQEVKP